MRYDAHLGRLRAMQTFYWVDEIRKSIRGPIPFAEFLRVPSMSCGIYVLKPGEEDLQRPHNQDEIYYVISGAGRISVTPKGQLEVDRAVVPGDVIFVAAREYHRFHGITEELVLLVVFAPAMTL